MDVHVIPNRKEEPGSFFSGIGKYHGYTRLEKERIGTRIRGYIEENRTKYQDVGNRDGRREGIARDGKNYRSSMEGIYSDRGGDHPERMG